MPFFLMAALAASEARNAIRLLDAAISFDPEITAALKVWTS
jgi:hypothetical protein